MNVLTQQATSIVDPTPGTTADTKVAVIELHNLGPVKLFDTAGLDESLGLGFKKHERAMALLEEIDIAVLVIDPIQALQSQQLHVEDKVATTCRRLGRPLVLVCNVQATQTDSVASGSTLEQALTYCKSVLTAPSSTPTLVTNLVQQTPLQELVDVLHKALPTPENKVELLPFVGGTAPVLLHIPLDNESPSGRLLRPQEMALEYLLRLRVPVGVVRVDLKLARSNNSAIAQRERDRFFGFFNNLGGDQGVQLVLTDSQAIDIMHAWLPHDVPLTTFSVMMINQTSGGNLPLFQQGATALDGLQSGDKILIAEACNHDRIAEDIGTVQIPQKLNHHCPGVQIEHCLGREFPGPDELRSFKLAIHCGGCMISKQQASARVARLAEAGIPVTNYGMALAWFQGADALKRVLAPWVPDTRGTR